MNGQAVPADDLPGSLVPVSDLPGGNPVTVTDPKAVPGNQTEMATPQRQEPAAQRAMRSAIGIPERFLGQADAALALGSSIPAQIAGRGWGVLNAFLPSNYGSQEGAARAQAEGATLADTLTYEPRSARGREELDRLRKMVSASKIEGMGPMMTPVTGVNSGVPVPVTRTAPPKTAAAAKAGFSLTPDDAGAGVVARGAAGLSGEQKLARQISNKNAAVATEKVAKDIGLPEGAELSIDNLKAIRKEAGSQYEAVRNTGRVTSDKKYTEALDKLGEKYRSAAKDFPGLARDDVEQVITGLKRESFDANSAVDLIGQLRESADQAFRGGNGGLGKVYRGGADALEAQLERHLEVTGQNPQLVQNFRDARKRIAKTYLAEKSLVGDEVNPQAYRKALEKGQPLSGGSREVAEFARDFERSSQKPTQQSLAAPTWSDVMMAAVTGGKSLAKEAALVGARPLTRGVLASRPYQRLQASQFAGEVPVMSPDVAQALGLAPIVGAAAAPQEKSR